MSSSAVVFGGSGGVGQGIVKALASSKGYSKVTLIGRKSLDLPSSDDASDYSKFDQKTIDFNRISEFAETFKGHDVAFYAIGVSQRTVTEQVYRRIEHDNALEIGKMLKEGGCKDVHWVTGQGTSKSSWFLFGKVKAAVEEGIAEMKFRRTTFYRPAAVITPGTHGVLRVLDWARLMSVESNLMGRAIVANSLQPSANPVEIWENGQINRFGKSLPN